MPAETLLITMLIVRSFYLILIFKKPLKTKLKKLKKKLKQQKKRRDVFVM